MTFWEEYGNDIESLGVVGGGILVYALVVNAFYQTISKRVMFGKVEGDGRIHVGGPFRGFIYLAMFPLVSLLFFLLLSLSLLFLSGEDQEVVQVFTLAMAIVGAVRAAAYFSEATSHDLAKMLPLGLLGVFLVRFQFTDLSSSFKQMFAITDHFEVLAVYFAIVVALEYILRALYLTIKAVRDSNRKRTLRALK